MIDKYDAPMLVPQVFSDKSPELLPTSVVTVIVTTDENGNQSFHHIVSNDMMPWMHIGLLRSALALAEDDWLGIPAKNGDEE